MEHIGELRLGLDSGFSLYLDKVYFVTCIRRNLLSISGLLKLGYSLMFNNSGVDIYHDSILVGHATLCDGLFILTVSHECNFSSSCNPRKRKRDLNTSFSLWHKRLGHISNDRIHRLVHNNILHNLDFSYFSVCVECIKGKFTKTHKKTSTRSSSVLEVIHTDICGPFPHKTFSGESYFITFTDDYSCYGYIYLLKEKSESLEKFKSLRRK